MLPLAFFRIRAFAAAGATTLIAYGGLFGALFVLGLVNRLAERRKVGLRALSMTLAMVCHRPRRRRTVGSPRLARFCAERSHEALRRCPAIATHAYPDVAYATLAPGLAAAGIGAATLLVPVQSVLVGAVAPELHGQAAGDGRGHPASAAASSSASAVIAGVFTAHGTTAAPTPSCPAPVPRCWSPHSPSPATHRGRPARAREAHGPGHSTVVTTADTETANSANTVLGGSRAVAQRAQEGVEFGGVAAGDDRRQRHLAATQW